MGYGYYGVQRPYGVTTLNTGGSLADHLYKFRTKAELEAWVRAGEQTREIASSRCAEVRKAQKAARDFGLHYPLPI